MAGGSFIVRLRAKRPYKETQGIESTVLNSGYGNAKPSTSKPKGDKVGR
ncbi:hypothetical protein [Herbiconiux daphne]|uniref:Uncharacterized protein n=1 Tax=Herbiconiux daphne TaxID=2970914 RepID=A0ABT2H971_9MICO|nr:hypothetical protein [Herbiconiux daphne]MCS5736466.1 hypothetical protein [Herbiconiux daphne]